MVMFVVQHLICRRSRWLYFFLFLSFRVYRERRSSWWLLLFFSLCIKKKKNALDVSFHGFSTPPAFVWCRQAKKGWAEERLWCPQHLPAGGKLFTSFLFSPTPIRVLLYYDDALPFSHFYFHRFRLILLIWWQLSGTLSLPNRLYISVYLCNSIYTCTEKAMNHEAASARKTTQTVKIERSLTTRTG